MFGECNCRLLDRVNGGPKGGAGLQMAALCH